MDHRYYYLDADGNVQGPFWLSVMRELHSRGRFSSDTEVSLNGTQHWQRLEYHPEIYESTMRVPALKRMAKAKSDPVRLIVWTIVLFLAYAAYVVVNMTREKPRRPALEAPPPAVPAP